MTLNAADFEFLRDLLHRDAAIVLEPEKAYRVEAALGPLGKQHGHAAVGDLLRQARTDPALRRRVIEAMTVNETSFFRDLYPFDALRRAVLPTLLARRGRERRLDVWCAACSTGQEPYSIALLLREHFPELNGWTIRILGTDLSEGVLEKAREGRYTQLEVNRGLPVGLLMKHFTREGMHWRVSEQVRRSVEFKTLNLARPWPSMGPFDVVFLRNVLIYFDAPSKRRVLETARGVLRPDGALFLGGAETTLQLTEAFERVPFERHGYYRAA